MPIFLNQRAKADTSVAQAEGNAIAKTIQTMLAGRAGTTFSNGATAHTSISVQDGVGTIHYGNGGTMVRETFDAPLSEGSVLTGGIVANTTTQQEDFCFRVQHGSGASAVYTQAGLQPEGFTCYNGVADADRPHPPSLSYDSDTDTIIVTPAADTDGRIQGVGRAILYNTDARIAMSAGSPWGNWANAWPITDNVDLAANQSVAPCIAIASTAVNPGGNAGTCYRPAAIGEHLPGGTMTYGVRTWGDGFDSDYQLITVTRPS